MMNKSFLFLPVHGEEARLWMEEKHPCQQCLLLQDEADVPTGGKRLDYLARASVHHAQDERLEVLLRFFLRESGNLDGIHRGEELEDAAGAGG